MRSITFKLFLCIVCTGLGTTQSWAGTYGAGSSNPDEKACRKILELEGLSLSEIHMPEPTALRAEHNKLVKDYESAKKAVLANNKDHDKFLKDFHADLRSDGILKDLGRRKEEEDPRDLLRIKYDEAFRFFHMKRSRWSLNGDDLLAYMKQGEVFLKRTHDYDRGSDTLHVCTQSEGLLTVKSCSTLNLRTGRTAAAYVEELDAEKRFVKNGRFVSAEEYMRRRWQETFEHGLPVEPGKATRLTTRCKPYLAALLSNSRR